VNNNVRQWKPAWVAYAQWRSVGEEHRGARAPRSVQRSIRPPRDPHFFHNFTLWAPFLKQFCPPLFCHPAPLPMRYIFLSRGFSQSHCCALETDKRSILGQENNIIIMFILPKKLPDWCCGQDLNPQPFSWRSNAITTKPASHCTFSDNIRNT